MKPSVSSLYQAVELRQQIPPLLIGERTNANGSKLFRERLLADDYQGCLQIGLEQEANGAQVLDLCAAYAGRDELRDMVGLVTLFARSVKLPVMIDSTTPEVIEACLKLYPGRCIVNSINLEDGGRTARRVCGLLKKYGAAVVALTINEKGMAMTAEEKVATARRIYDIAVGEFGLRPSDLLFDALTFTVGAGDVTLRDAAVQTLRAIREIKAALPGVGTVLGVSNISFGLSPASRKVLNSVFLHEAVSAGLDAAIIDAGKVLPLARIQEADRAVCLDLLYDRGGMQEQGPLVSFIEHFKAAAPSGAADKPKTKTRFEGPEQAVYEQVLEGSKEHLEDNLSMLLQRLSPLAIINQILVPAMRHVGELFGSGELLLPFVLQSAEVMKKAVSWLEPLMEKGEVRQQTRVLLATVQGDVHDIGKNLVDIILSNNGYKVFNLGIKVPTETIIEKAREHQADVIGLSGLLVKSAMVMRESMRQYREAGLTQPILLGGAALTPRFVAESCAPEYGAPVVYCADAFAGLKAVRAHEEGRLVSTVWTQSGTVAALKPGARGAEVARDNPVPVPPFLGLRHVESIDPAAVLPYVNLQALFRGRWGYRRAKLTVDAYDRLISETVQPIYDGLVRRAVEEGLIQPRVAYGYYRCFSAGDAVHVEDAGVTHVFQFPRQAEAPHLCIADYFKSAEEGGDIAGFFVVSVGDVIDREAHALYEANRYHDYLMLHGFGVEVTDALAEYWHAVMRRELGIAGAEPTDLTGYVTQGYQGSRFGFGYPACPDLEAHRPVFALLRPERIGVTLTETMQMVPELSTCAIVAHHPQAKYFAV
jgi:5-methyltetrahydrofolate--homocysteine methyltransferase